jgi:hypothetical protein
MSTPEDVYRELIRRVPEKTLSAMMQLNNSHLQGDYGLEEGILRSNAIGIAMPVLDVPDSRCMGYNALFLETSRMNHRYVLWLSLTNN